jgi:mono/diheme cytochrome c family protein
VASGLALYTANCAGCHGNGKASDAKVSTPTGITTVMNSVGTHKSMGLNTKFSAQDLLDLAAYVASPK